MHEVGDNVENPRCLTITHTDINLEIGQSHIFEVNPPLFGAGGPELSCGSNVLGTPAALSFELQERSDLIMVVDNGDDYARVLSLRSECDDNESEIRCLEGGFINASARDLAPGRYTLSVQRTSTFDWRPLSVELTTISRVTACNDGVDNDNDGLIDGEDYGCSTPASNSERPIECRAT